MSLQIPPQPEDNARRVLPLDMSPDETPDRAELIEAVSRYERELHESTEDAASCNLLIRLAECRGMLGQLEEGLSCLDAALAITAHSTDVQAPTLGRDILIRKAQFLDIEGHYGDAAICLKEAIELEKRNGENNHALVAELLSNAADAFYRAEQPDQTKFYLEQSLCYTRAAFGNQDIHTLKSHQPFGAFSYCYT